MRNIDFNEISVFIKVVQAGSFSRAAKLLNMPNSTVSARVSSLEERLGMTLLQRTTRQLSLTQAGRAYYDQCLAGFEEIFQAETFISSTQNDPSGDLRITAPVFLGSTLLSEVITECKKQFPKLNLEVILNDRSMDLISERIDIAIRAGDLDDSSLIVRKLGTIRFSVFASPTYLKRNPAPEHPKDLQNHTCIHFTPMGRDSWKFKNGKNLVTVPLAGSTVIDELHLVKALTVAGAGIALLPNYICKFESEKNKLVKLLPDWQSENRVIQIVHLPQKFPSTKIRSFLDIAIESIKRQIAE